ncbi:MAG TPA: VWA domain-containing protein [Longimicrobiales bacterium]|nr:VWA domain-containing protein [Longimicrobiales bacterium]
MGALNPLFLLAAAAVAVPIFLHLAHRHEARRVSFPALRYLERTEREHARRIRLRQLLLLVVRVAVVLLLVGAGARLIFTAGRGTSHPPTAAVLVLDNSLSSGLVVGETRVLDQLKGLALAALEEASPEDRFWVLRAGESWLPALPGNAAEARAAVLETEATHTAGDLTAALERAAELLATSDLEEREIHLLSDLQRSAFVLPGAEPAGRLPVVLWSPDEEPPSNRAIADVLVGAGLPPLAGQRTELTVRGAASGDTASWAVRLVLDGRVRGAGTLGSGTETVIALPPAGPGWVQGWVEADPDDLSADDRRWFAYRSRAAPALAVGGAPELFVSEAVAVLEGSGRVRLVAPEEAELLLAHAGERLAERGEATAALVIPSADPALLPALNRRLADAGIPWRYAPHAGAGEAELTGESLPDALVGIRARSWLALEPIAERAPDASILARAGEDPWAVEGRDAAGRRYLLVASPLVDSATTLPVSTGMVRFVDWAAGAWAAAGGSLDLETGSTLPAPPGAERVRFPSGRSLEIDATRLVRGTSEAGIYAFLAADTVVSLVALNPPERESDLSRLERRELAGAVGPEVTRVSDPEDWPREAFRRRSGPELAWPFALVAALLLLTEALLASSSRTAAGQRPRPRRSAEAPSAVR